MNINNYKKLVDYTLARKKANLVILDDLKEVKINSVYYMGQKIENKYDENHENIGEKYKDLLNIVHIDWFNITHLKNPTSDYEIGLTEGQLLTNKIDLSSPNMSTFHFQ